MKIVTSFVGALLLVGSLGTSTAFSAAPGVISNQVLNEGSYCHLRFPAIRGDTLSWDRPVLKDPSEGDIIRLLRTVRHRSAWRRSNPPAEAGTQASLAAELQ